MSIEFAWPWLGLLLPLPWLLRWQLPKVQDAGRAALRVPFLDDFIFPEAASGGHRMGRHRYLLWLAALAWFCLILAVMRPLWRGDPVALPAPGRDLMLAVDLSLSMREKDFATGVRRANRLQAAQTVASDFISRRVGDRVGLILFGTQAYLQSPLSFDRDTVQGFLNEAQIGLAGEKTAIGDAIGLAIKHLRQRDTVHRILILLTDGTNTAGAVDPLAAARLAATEGLRVYTIGIGSEAGGFFSFSGSTLDEKTLASISEITGGRYFRARDTQELEAIYRLLDELEPTADEPLLFRPQMAMYYWPLTLAVMLAALIILLRVD